MTDYEINCAVAEKLGLELEHDHRNYSPQSDSVMWYAGKTYHDADYCNDPRDYMKLAIEYKIDITYGNIEGQVWATARDDNGPLIDSGTKTETGRAVCEVFLMMEIDK